MSAYRKKKKNTGVGCHSLLRGIFPTQESNQHPLALAGRFFASEPPGNRGRTALSVTFKGEINVKVYSCSAAGGRKLGAGVGARQAMDADGRARPAPTWSPRCLEEAGLPGEAGLLPERRGDPPKPSDLSLGTRLQGCLLGSPFQNLTKPRGGGGL